MHRRRGRSGSWSTAHSTLNTWRTAASPPDGKLCTCELGPTFTHALKEWKERELEHCAFNAEHMEDGGFPLQMVSFAHAQKERKERELEHFAFNAEHMEDGGFPLQMVSFAHAQ
jgi:hypothetical protein